jgi:hypothetical protein
MNQFFLHNMLMGLTLGLLLWTHPPVWAACNPNIPETTPTSDFILDDVNGIAIHRKTNLTWMRCTLGQNWDWTNKTCSGAPSTYTWGQALRVADEYSFAGYSDWRLPNIKELMSIQENRCYDNAVNREVFPAMVVSYWYWSSSTHTDTPDHALGVDFYSGNTVDFYMGWDAPVHLVRSGLSSGSVTGWGEVVP